MCGVTTPLKEALTALADALAKRPAEEILFEWLRSGRLVGELSVLLKRRHPDVQARIDEISGEARQKAAVNRPVAWMVVRSSRSWLDLNLAVAGFHFRNISIRCEQSCSDSPLATGVGSAT